VELQIKEFRSKLKRIKTLKGLSELYDKISNNMNSSYIDWEGYDRKTHVMIMREQLKLIETKMTELESLG
jgi:archaellum component FlaC